MEDDKNFKIEIEIALKQCRKEHREDSRLSKMIFKKRF
jgi:hypothetical protein